MAEIFKTKVRKVGSSAGIVISQKTLKEAKAEIGDEIEFVILPKKKKLKMFGAAKSFKKPFKRNKKVRDF